MTTAGPGDREGFLFTLDNGRTVFLGPVLPEDRWRLVQGLAQLSPSSRYLRFFTGLQQFSQQQIRYFTEVDQIDHVAWGALDPSLPRWPGIALARFVRLADTPDVAEFAIVVVDAWQRQGLGNVLLAILYLQAQRRNIATLRGLVLPENRALCRWLGELGAAISDDRDTLVIDLPTDRPLPHVPAAQRFRSALVALAGRIEPSRGRPVIQ